MNRCKFIYNKTTDTNVCGSRCRNSAVRDYCQKHHNVCIHNCIDSQACKLCAKYKHPLRQCEFVYSNNNKTSKKGEQCKNNRIGKLQYCYIHKYTCTHGVRKNHCRACKRHLKNTSLKSDTHLVAEILVKLYEKN